MLTGQPMLDAIDRWRLVLECSLINLSIMTDVCQCGSAPNSWFFCPCGQGETNQFAGDDIADSFGVADCVAVGAEADGVGAEWPRAGLIS
jgi:hypothetical protein